MRTKHIFVLIHIKKISVNLEPSYMSEPSSKVLLTVKRGASFMDHFGLLCLSVILSCLFIATLWSTAWKRLLSWLSCM